MASSIAFVDRGGSASGRPQVEHHLDDARVPSSTASRNRVAKDLEHRQIVGERRGLEALEPVGVCDRCQALQQGRPKSFAVQIVGDSECCFSRDRAGRSVRRHGDRLKLACVVPQREEGEPGGRVR